MYKLWVFCCLYIAWFCCFAYSLPQLKWDFNKNSSNGYINESKSNNENRGFLLPGTHVIKGNWSSLVLYFKGSNSGLIIDNITSDCFARPWRCSNGLTINFWVRFIKWDNESIILSSSNVNIGFTRNDTIVASVWNGTNQWQTSYKLHSPAWQCLTLTWNKKTLRLYTGGVLATETSNTTREMSVGKKAVQRRLVLGNTAESIIKPNSIRMYVDHLKIWNNTLKANTISPACGIGSWSSIYKTKYFSQAFTSLDYKDKALYGKLFKAFNVSDFDQCIKHCMDNQNKCKSINYGKEKTSLKYSCELNNVEAKNNRILMKKREQFQFYDVYWTD